MQWYFDDHPMQHHQTSTFFCWQMTYKCASFYAPIGFLLCHASRTEYLFVNRHTWPFLVRFGNNSHPGGTLRSLFPRNCVELRQYTLSIHLYTYIYITMFSQVWFFKDRMSTDECIWYSLYLHNAAIQPYTMQFSRGRTCRHHVCSTYLNLVSEHWTTVYTGVNAKNYTISHIFLDQIDLSHWWIF